MPKQPSRPLADPGCVPGTCRGVVSNVFSTSIGVVNVAYFWLIFDTDWSDYSAGAR